MTKNTRTALTAILAADETITKEAADAALKVLDGKAKPADDAARIIRTTEAARILGGVTTKTLRAWTKTGVLVPVYARGRKRRIGYTSDSVRALASGMTQAKRRA